VLSLLNVLLVARALGPVGRGDVAFLTTIAILTSNLATLGVEQANANLTGRRPELRASLATNSLLLALLLGVAAAGAVAGLIAAFPALAGESEPALRWLVLAALPALVLKLYLDYSVRADYGYAYANVAWSLEAITNVTVNGTLFALGLLSVGTAVATWLAGQLLATLVLLAFIVRRAAGFGRPDLGLARHALGFGLKTHAGRIMTLGNYRLDQWFVGAISGSRELGLYSVAVAWAEALFYLPTALTLAQRPDLVRASPAEAARQAAAATRVALLVTLPTAIGFALAAPFLTVVVFGEEFRESIPQLRVLAFGGFGIVLLKLLGNALTAQGRPLRATAGVGVAFVATVALDIALIPPYGGLGAAIASTAAYSAAGLAIAVLFGRALGVGPAQLVPRPSDLRLLGEAVARVRARRG